MSSKFRRASVMIPVLPPFKLSRRSANAPKSRHAGSRRKTVFAGFEAMRPTRFARC